jgi:hypothetical protein
VPPNKRRPTLKRIVWLIMFLSAAVALATAVVTTQMTGPSQDATKVVLSPQPGKAAFLATINPETGQIEETAAPPKMILDTRTQQALRRDTEGLRQTYHPNGAVSVNLQGRFRSVSFARIDENGKLVVCADDAVQAEIRAQGHPIGKIVPDRNPEVK